MANQKRITMNVDYISRGYVMRDISFVHLPLILLVCLLIAVPFSAASLDEDQLGPVISKIEEGNEYILLEWTVPEEADADNITMFHVWRKDLPTPFNPVRSDIFQYNDTTVDNGVEYSYSISAEYRNQSLKAESDILYASPGVPPGPPTITGIYQVNGSVSIYLDLSENNGGFPVDEVLMQRKSGSQNFTTLKILNSTTSSHIDHSTLYGIEYTYRAITVNEKGPSSPSEEMTITLVPPPEVPDNVRDLTTDNDTTSITITWTAPEDDGGSEIIGYRIMKSVNDSGFSERDIVGEDVFEFTDLEVYANTNYTYIVAAFNEIGEVNDPPTVKNRIIIPILEEDIDDNDDEEGSPVSIAIFISGVIGIVIIAIAIFIYLRLTEEVDEKEMEP